MLSCDNGESQPIVSELISEAVMQLNEIQSLHFTLELENAPIEVLPGFAVSYADGDVVRPDKMQAELRGNALGMGFAIEFRSIGESQYVTNPLAPDRWEILPNPAITGALLDPHEGVGALLTRLTNLELTDRAHINGINTYVITGQTDNVFVAPLFQSSPADGATTIQAWIGVEDSFVYQVILTGATVVGDPDGVTRIIQFSAFDDVIEINRPL